MYERLGWEWWKRLRAATTTTASLVVGCGSKRCRIYVVEEAFPYHVLLYRRLSGSCRSILIKFCTKYWQRFLSDITYNHVTFRPIIQKKTDDDLMMMYNRSVWRVFTESHDVQYKRMWLVCTKLKFEHIIIFTICTSTKEYFSQYIVVHDNLIR